ncbi:MAG: hypothetical protein AAF074_15055 [Pseudomonadota bacterium]
MSDDLRDRSRLPAYREGRDAEPAGDLRVLVRAGLLAMSALAAASLALLSL